MDSRSQEVGLRAGIEGCKVQWAEHGIQDLLVKSLPPEPPFPLWYDEQGGCPGGCLRAPQTTVRSNSPGGNKLKDWGGAKEQSGRWLFLSVPENYPFLLGRGAPGDSWVSKDAALCVIPSLHSSQRSVPFHSE